MNTQQIVHLLKKYKHLIKDYLELINDNQHFAHLILLLRDILTQTSEDLTEYFNLNDTERPIVGYLQMTYTCLDRHKESRHVVDKHLHNARLRHEHLSNIQTTLNHTVEQLEPLLALSKLPENQLEFIKQAETKYQFLKHECLTACQFIEKEMLELNYITSNVLNITQRLHDVPAAPQPLLTLTAALIDPINLIQQFESIVCTHISEHRRRLRLGLDLHNVPIPQNNLEKIKQLEAQLQQLLRQQSEYELEQVKQLQAELKEEERLELKQYEHSHEDNRRHESSPTPSPHPFGGSKNQKDE